MKTPLTILTGYLGAGKTTLLRRLLAYAAAHQIKLAVIMNEFGEVGVDADIIKGTNVEMVELAGGCVCCSLTGEFDAAVREVIAKVRPDHIVLETTGVAEPDALAIDVQENLSEVRLDAVVTVVDADAFMRFPTLGHTGRVQIELADILLINKTDLVAEQQLHDIRQRLEEINDRATILEASHGQVEPSLLLDVRAGPRETAKLMHQHAPHTPAVQAVVIESNRPIEEERFNEFVAGISPQVYRAKGFVVFSDGRTMLFNYVAGRHDLEEWESQRKNTQIVCIGTNVEGEVHETLQDALSACEEK